LPLKIAATPDPLIKSQHSADDFMSNFFQLVATCAIAASLEGSMFKSRDDFRVILLKKIALFWSKSRSKNLLSRLNRL
jgi:hypothetical protein